MTSMSCSQTANEGAVGAVSSGEFDSMKALEFATNVVRRSEVLSHLLTIDAVLADLGISRTTLYKWRKDGLLRYTRIGRRVFIFKDDIVSLMQQNSHGGQTHE